MSTNMTNNMELSAPWIYSNETSILPDSSNYEFADFLQLPSDTMEAFMELGTIPEVKQEEHQNINMDENDLLMDIMSEIGIGSPSASETSVCDMESTQSLIDEVETYLQTVEEPRTEVTAPLTINTNPVMEEEKSETDKIFDALTTGKVYHEDALTPDLDFGNAYTTSVTGKDGQQVIIIIAPPSSPPSSMNKVRVAAPPASPNFSLSPSAVPSPLSPGMNSDDSDWSPAVVAGNTNISKQQQRKKYQRKVRSVYPPVTPYPKEKKERKKAQNRTAAYKYREKKKAEWDKVDQELDEVIAKNSQLKKQVSDMEVELRCLKKLMMETGLADYIR